MLYAGPPSSMGGFWEIFFLCGSCFFFSKNSFNMGLISWQMLIFAWILLIGIFCNPIKTVTDLATDFTMCQHYMTFPYSRQYHHWSWLISFLLAIHNTSSCWVLLLLDTAVGKSRVANSWLLWRISQVHVVSYILQCALQMDYIEQNVLYITTAL